MLGTCRFVAIGDGGATWTVAFTNHCGATISAADGKVSQTHSE